MSGPQVYIFDVPLVHSIVYRMFCLASGKTEQFADSWEDVAIPDPMELGPSVYIVLEKLCEEMESTPIELMQMLLAVIKNYGERHGEVIRWIRDLNEEEDS